MSKFVSPKGEQALFNYVTVFSPRAFKEGDDLKYSVLITIPKTNAKTIAAFREAENVELEAAVKAKAWGAGIVRKVKDKSKLRDGDEETDKDDNPKYPGCYFISVESKTRPGLFDAQGNPVESEEEVYSGCFGRFLLNFFYYDNTFGKGVSCELKGLLVTEKGERLSGGSTAKASDFGIESDFDDDL